MGAEADDTRLVDVGMAVFREESVSGSIKKRRYQKRDPA